MKAGRWQHSDRSPDSGMHSKAFLVWIDLSIYLFRGLYNNQIEYSHGKQWVHFGSFESGASWGSKKCNPDNPAYSRWLVCVHPGLFAPKGELLSCRFSGLINTFSSEVMQPGTWLTAKSIR